MMAPDTEPILPSPAARLTAVDPRLFGAAQGMLPAPSAPLVAPALPTVTALVARWVAETPDAAAVEEGGERWTYRRLGDEAAQVAERLRSAGIGDGERIVLHGRRSAGLVSHMLGVLSAGGALVVVDADLPAARQRLMVEAAGARWLLTVAGGPPDLGGAVRFVPAQASGAAAAVVATEPAGGDPAYVFFTSGSTGVPKGVLGSHGGLAHFLLWQRSAFDVGPGDRGSLLTSLSFDVLLRDVFLPLVSGGCLVLPGADDHQPGRVLAWLAERAITVVHAVPSLARLWLRHEPGALGSERLRATFFAGEPLDHRLVERWRRLFPSARVVNLYGPTETTLAKCAWEVTQPVPGVQPVGRPLPQTQALVLAEGDRLCGVGEVGRVVLRTPFRSLGYVGAPAEEWLRFRTNPFTGDPGDVVYETGDLGRYRADGALEVMGRADQQVKVRGARIEPAEVEAALRTVDGVSDAAVTAHDPGDGDLQLVAYVVSTPPRAPADLRRALEALLPSYMVPSLFLPMAALPLNGNGKLDRRALPDPRGVLAARGGEPPATPLERWLAETWSGLLRIDRVCRDDDFFTVGGDSVRAVVLASRMAERTGRSGLTPAAVYAYPTLRRQAAWLEREPPAEEAPPHVVLNPGRPRTVFAFPPLLGFGAVYHKLAAYLDACTLVAFDFEFREGADPATAYAHAVRERQPRGPYALLGYSAGGNLAFEVARRLEAQGEHVAGIVMLDAKRMVTPEHLSDEEIERLVEGNLEHLAGLLRADDAFRALASEEAGRGRLAARLRAFLRYERGRTNHGFVAAEVHYVASNDRRVCTTWSEVAGGGFFTHAGTGRHVEMAHGDNVEPNGRLISRILEGFA